MKDCDHKFVDSNVCLKCGWKPPAVEVQPLVMCVDDWWIRFGDPKQSSSFMGDLAGKYLFFSENQEDLKEIAKREITKHGFEIAKVSTMPNGNDYVLCLYWQSDSRKYELFDRYKAWKGIKYRWWKTNADTRAGKYSREYLQHT